MKNGFKILLYFIFVFISLTYLSKVYCIKNAESVSIKNAKNIDTYFVGSSGFVKDISPMIIYDNSGITSYVVGASWAQIPLNYYMIKENTKSNMPKLIVLDMESFFDEKIEENDHLHYAVDKLPLNFNKIEFINYDLWDLNLFDKLSFLFPVIRFHDKWNTIKLDDYIRPLADFKNNSVKNGSCTKNNCYGNILLSGILSDAKVNYMQNNNRVIKEYNNGSKEYTLKIKEFCDKNNIKLLLLMPPHQLWSNTKYEELSKWAYEENLDYVDLNIMIDELDIDLNLDFYDSGHLNINGVIKVSKYLSEYLKNNYNFEDHRGDSEYDSWDKDLNKYKVIESDYFKAYDNNLKGRKVQK